MKINAKQLTFLYFSIVASAIIIIHASVFLSTTEDIERLYAESRLDSISNYLLKSLDNHQIKKQPEFLLQTQGKAEFDPFIRVYFDSALIPKELNIPKDVALGFAFETEDEVNNKTYFVLKKNLGPSYGEAYLVLDNSYYELIEESLPTSHAKQLIISFALLIVSLLVVLKISARLTNPISKMVDDLSNRQADSLEPIQLPNGIVPTELEQLVTSFNDFQERINLLVERERSFNRYASHELRTPLMVMKGAINLLAESKDPAFVEKQRIRLDKATNEMNEFIQTLLSLTKLQPSENMITTDIGEGEFKSLIDNHRYLLEGKEVAINIIVEGDLKIKMPEAAFNILIGNLIKNAFANTFEGQVDINVVNQIFEIRDTGVGLLDQTKTNEGYGLGLLLVKDICKQFSCVFSLVANSDKGCTASLVFPKVNL
jgi:signal transduction histidine kinase